MQMLDIFIDNIFIKVSGQVFQQTIYIQMGTYCAPKLFLCAYETGVLKGRPKNRDRKLAQYL